MNTERLAKLQEYLQNDPSDPFLVYAIAQEYDRGGEEKDAENWYNRLLEEHPGYVATYYHFGKLLERTGKTAEAIQMYETGIEVAMKAGDRHAAGELREALQAHD
jgi:tetratricopeptide (TPR) repeat protein